MDFCTTLGSGAVTLPCPHRCGAGLSLAQPAGHTAVAFGCSQLLVGTRLFSVGVWQLQQCLPDSQQTHFATSQAAHLW